MSSENDIERCPICLDFQNDDSIIMECCNKLIHAYCLSEWLQRRNNCPLCRAHQSSYYDNYNLNIDIEQEINQLSEALNNFSIGISRPQFRRPRRMGQYFSFEEFRPLLESRVGQDPVAGSGSFIRNIFNRPSADLGVSADIGISNPHVVNVDMERVPIREIHNLGISFQNRVNQQLDDDLDNLNNERSNIMANLRSQVEQLEHGISRSNQYFNEINEILDNNLHLFDDEDSLGISFVNPIDNDNFIGISSLNIHTDRDNNMNIDMNNGEITLNFNVNEQSSIMEIMNQIFQNVNNINQQLNNRGN